MSTGYLVDSFDLLNVRDLDLIEQAGALCTRLVLGVFSDEYVEQLYGRRPVVPLSERIELLRHVRGVSEVVVHDPSRRSDTEAFVGTDVPVEERDGFVWLSPRRYSASAVLRQTFSSLSQEVVA